MCVRVTVKETMRMEEKGLNVFQVKENIEMWISGVSFNVLGGADSYEEVLFPVICDGEDAFLTKCLVLVCVLENNPEKKTLFYFFFEVPANFFLSQGFQQLKNCGYVWLLVKDKPVINMKK